MQDETSNPSALHNPATRLALRSARPHGEGKRQPRLCPCPSDLMRWSPGATPRDTKANVCTANPAAHCAGARAMRCEPGS
eukprot:356712-Chlamydomonas_euryale.AAC.4